MKKGFSFLGRVSFMGEIILYSGEEFAFMRRAGRLAVQTLDYLEPKVEVGMTTDEVNRICHDFIVSHGGKPASLHYRGFPKSVCTSVNHVVCHGIPGQQVLKEGDIMNVDVTVIVEGFYGDTSRMIGVGKIGISPRRLVEVTGQCLWKGIEAASCEGATLGDIGYAIEHHARKYRYEVVRELCGHGIGRNFHESPSVLHFGRPAEGIRLKAGMCFTIEPMINAGRKEIKLKQDGWTIVTRDLSLSAQYEHTIGIREEGIEIFTLSPKENVPPTVRLHKGP